MRTLFSVLSFQFTENRSAPHMDVSSFIRIHVRLILTCSSILAAAAASTTASGRAKRTSTAVLIVVDQSGHGDYSKIQDAIDSVPSNNSELVFISVKPGTYREKVVVPVDKPFITVSGDDASNTVITWGDGGDIIHSPTLTVLASDFIGRYLTIQNTFGKSGKGVALRVSGDRSAWYSCRMLSYQDTLLDEAGRHYYRNCYIEGAVDFICGNAASLFEGCHIHSIAEVGGAISAQRRESPQENTGFAFVRCRITGTGSTVLGRPWGSYSRVVWALSYMSSAIQPEGWNDWGDSNRQRTVYYGEYKCYGPGADRTKRVGWSRNLSKAEAAPFMTKNIVEGKNGLDKPLPILKGLTFVKIYHVKKIGHV